MSALRAKMRVAPRAHYGWRRGVEAIQESRMAHALAKPPLVLTRENRANQSRRVREAASKRRQQAYAWMRSA